MPQDSTGAPIEVGDTVAFRGKDYTIKSFIPGKGRFGTDVIDFVEDLHIDEVPDEIGVDRVRKGVR